MTLLWVCCLWVLVSALVCLLPMRLQHAPGVVLLLAAPVLIFWTGQQIALWAALLALFAFIRMFRNPLRSFRAHARRSLPEVPT